MTSQFFDVEKQPIFLQNGTQVEGKSALVRLDTNKPIGIVGTLYEVLNDKNLIAYVTDVLDSLKIEHKVRQHNIIKGGSRTITEIDLPNINIKAAKKDDTLLFRLHVTNSFDCTTSAKITAGCYRLICKNGMVIGKADISVGYKHLSGITSKVTDLYNNYIISKSKDVQKQLTVLQNIKFKSSLDMIELIEKENFLGKRYAENVVEALDDSSTPKDLSGWQMYNAYTYVISHKITANADNKLNRLKKLNTLALGWQNQLQ